MTQEEKVEEAKSYCSYSIDLQAYRRFGDQYLKQILLYCEEKVIDMFQTAINLKVVDRDKTIAYLIDKEHFLDRLKDLLNTIASSTDLQPRQGVLD